MCKCRPDGHVVIEISRDWCTPINRPTGLGRVFVWLDFHLPTPQPPPKYRILMWFFTSPRNPYRETIEAKRTRRTDALKHAPAFSAEKHQEFLNVTGNGFS
jgi:hypothetical protein